MSRALANRSAPLARRHATLVLASCAGLMLPLTRAHAGPTGESVAAGTATFNRAGPLTTITASNNAIINYQSFSIPAGETVRFVQPSSDARVLNRVLGPDPSIFAGTLTSNGIVYIVNPSGVYFREGALVNVGGIYAAAARMNDADFAARVDKFTHISGPVANAGLIDAGRIALVGGNVTNTGTLNASGDAVVMASGSDVLIGSRGSVLTVTVARDQLTGEARPSTPSTKSPAPSVNNAGTINAPNARVALAAGDPIAVALRNTGTIRAASVRATASPRAGAIVSGTITSPDVAITAGRVDVVNATIDASGPTGGTIRIGGQQQGATGELTSADVVTVDRASTLRADSTTGPGGRVIVWSEQGTGFYGSASAAGAPGTSGGFIETSSRGALDVQPLRVSASSLGGTAGTWLLDPSNVTIRTPTLTGGTLTGNPLTFSPNAADTAVDAVAIVSALASGTSVVIQTYNPGAAAAGDINVEAPLTVNLTGGPASLTLRAARNINFNIFTGVFASGGALSVNLFANDGTGPGAPEPTTGTGGITFQPFSGLVTSGGSITTTGAFFAGPLLGQIDTRNDARTSAGAITMTHTGLVDFQAPVFAGNTSINSGPATIRGGWTSIAGGTLAINNSGLFTLDAAPINLAGAFSQTGAGISRLRQPINTTNSTISFAGPVELDGGPGTVILINSGSATTTFAGTIDSAPGTSVGLSMQGTGRTIFGSDVGVTTPLTGIETQPNAPLQIGRQAAGGPASVTVRTGASGIDVRGPLTIDTSATVDTGNAPAIFRSTIDSLSATARAFTVNSSGLTRFDQSIGVTQPLASLTTNPGGTVQLGSATSGGPGTFSITTSGVSGIDIGEAALLDGNATFSAGAGAIRLRSTVDSFGAARSLTLNASGLTRLDGPIGTGAPLTSLTTDAPGTSQFSGGTINATTAQFNDALTLAADTTINATTTFASTVGASSAGSASLTINGSSSFAQGAGAAPANALGALTLNNAAQLAGDFRTSNAGGRTGAITLVGPTTLTGNTTLTSTGAGITAGAINSPGTPFDLSFTSSAPGVTTINAPIGATAPVRTLTTSGPINVSAPITTALGMIFNTGPVALGSTLTAGGNIQFNAPVTLNADSTIATTANLSFLSSLNGPRGLTVNNPTSAVSFAQAFGNTSPLAFVTISSQSISGLAGNTTGAGSFTTVTGATVSGDLSASSLLFTGPTTLGTNAGPVTLTSGPAGIDFNGPVTLDAVAIVNSTSGPARFRSTIDSPNATARPLTVNSTGLTRFDRSIGATQPLASLTTNPGGTLQLGSASSGGPATITITTSGASGVDFGDAIALDAGTTINAATAPIRLRSTIDSPTTARALTLNTSGLTRLEGAIGATSPLASLTTDAPGSSRFAGATITTTGATTFNDPLLIDSNTSISASPAIFNSTVGSTVAGAATLTTKGAATFTQGAGPAGNELAAITLAGPSSLAGTFSTTNAAGGSGNITNNGSATLAADTTLASAGGIITPGIINGPFNLDVNTTGAGQAVFSSPIGAITPIAQLGVSGPAQIAAPITTSDLQFFSGPVQLASSLNAGNTITFAGPVSVTGASSLTSTAQDVVFQSSLNGPAALTVNTPAGNADFGATPFGQTTPLASLTVTGLTATNVAGTLAGPGTFSSSTSTTITGNLTSTGLTLNGPATLANPGTTLNARTGTLALNSTLNGVNPSLIADEIDLAGALTGTGTLTLSPFTLTRNIRVNDAANQPSALSITSGDLGNIGAGFSSLVIGAPGLSGTIATVGSTTFNNPVTLRAPLGAITTLGSISGGPGVSLTFDAPSVSLGGDLLTRGQPINIPGNITLSTVLTSIDTTNAGAVAAGADVALGPVNAATAGASGLQINSGTAGNQTLASIGATTPLSTLDLSGAGVTPGAIVRTTGNQSFQLPVTLARDTAFTSSAGGISFPVGSAINGPFNLTLSSSTGTAIAGPIGNTTPIGSGTGAALTINGLGATTFNSPITTAGPVVATAPVALASTLTINSSGASSFRDLSLNAATITTSGPLTLGASNTDTLTLAGGTSSIVATSASTTVNARVSGANNISFSHGSQTLTFNAPIGSPAPINSFASLGTGATVFNSTFNAAGTATLAGPVTLNAPTFVAAGGADFAGPLSLAVSSTSISTTNTNLIFQGAIDGASALSTSSGSGRTEFRAPVGATTALTRLTSTASETRLGANINTASGLTFIGNTTLDADVTLTNNLGSILFLGNVDSVSPGPARSLTVISNQPALRGLVSDAQLRNYAIPIGFAGSLGATAPLGNIYLNTNAAGTIDGRSDVPGLATIVFANSLTPAGRMPIAGTNLGASFVVNATNLFVMGFNEKLTAFGSLALSGSTLRLGDITALGNISASATTAIQIRARSADSIIGYSDTDIPTIASDTGVDFVSAGGIFNFNRVPTVVNRDGTNSTNNAIRPTFSSVTGGGDATGNLSTFTFRAYGARLNALLFRDRPSPDNVNYVALDLRAEGPTTANVSETIAPFVVVDMPSVPDTTSIGGAMRRQLEEMAIFVRSLSPGELVEFLIGRSLYNDRPNSSRPDAARLVSVGRLSMDLVRAAIDDYQQLSLRKDEISTSLQLAVSAYLEESESEDFEGKKFTAWLPEKPEHAKAMEDLRSFAMLYRKVEQLGLGPLELRDCKKAIAANVTPTDITPEQLVDAIDALNLIRIAPPARSPVSTTP